MPDRVIAAEDGAGHIITPVTRNCSVSIPEHVRTFQEFVRELEMLKNLLLAEARTSLIEPEQLGSLQIRNCGRTAALTATFRGLPRSRNEREPNSYTHYYNTPTSIGTTISVNNNSDFLTATSAGFEPSGDSYTGFVSATA